MCINVDKVSRKTGSDQIVCSQKFSCFDDFLQDVDKGLCLSNQGSTEHWLSKPSATIGREANARAFVEDQKPYPRGLHPQLGSWQANAPRGSVAHEQLRHVVLQQRHRLWG